MTNLRRILSLLLTIGVAVTVVVPPASADTSLLFGQTQSYSATMRADKRVVTHAKIVFTNGEETKKLSTTFSIPDNIKASSLTVYQIIPPKQKAKCETFETLEEWRSRTGVITPTAPTLNDNTRTQNEYNVDRKCIKPLPADYDVDYDFKAYASSPYYYDYNLYRGPDTDSKITFRKLQPTASGSTYNVRLSLPVESQKDGAIMVSYLGEGFVTEFGGTYKYNYQTLKVPEPVNNVQVDINLDQDLYSKGTRAQTTAAPSSSELSVQDGTGMAKGADQESRSLIELQNSIGSGGTITRTGKSLLPNDTFSVSGAFADSPWKLYAQEIFDAILLILLGAAMWWFFHRRNQRKKQLVSAKANENFRPKAEKKPNNVASATWKNEESLATDYEPHVNILAVIRATLLSGAGVVVTVGLLFIVGTGNYEIQQMTFPIGWIAGLYFLVVLPLFLTIRHGRKTVFVWATAETIMAIVLVLAISLAGSAMSHNPPHPYPANYADDCLNC